MERGRPEKRILKNNVPAQMPSLPNDCKEFEKNMLENMREYGGKNSEWWKLRPNAAALKMLGLYDGKSSGDASQKIDIVRKIFIGMKDERLMAKEHGKLLLIEYYFDGELAKIEGRKSALCHLLEETQSPLGYITYEMKKWAMSDAISEIEIFFNMGKECIISYVKHIANMRRKIDELGLISSGIRFDKRMRKLLDKGGGIAFVNEFANLLYSSYGKKQDWNGKNGQGYGEWKANVIIQEQLILAKKSSEYPDKFCWIYNAMFELANKIECGTYDIAVLPESIIFTTNYNHNHAK